MLRVALPSVMALTLLACSVSWADEIKKSNDRSSTCMQAVVTRVDVKENSLSVRTSDNNGKQIEKTYNLSPDTKCLDAHGQACSLSSLKPGDDVCITQDGDKVTEVCKHAQAIITMVDPENSTITVKMTDKDGKTIDKTFRLVEDTSYVDGNGRVEILNAFQSGDKILFVQANGMIKGLKKPISKK